MELETVKLSELKEFPDNPRVGDVRRIGDSLMKNGQYRPLTVNRKDNVILTGNHTYRAMLKLGWEECLVSYVDVDYLKKQMMRVMLKIKQKKLY